MFGRPRNQPVGGNGDVRRLHQHQQQQHSQPQPQQPQQSQPQQQQQSQPQQQQPVELDELLHSLCDQLPNNNPIKESYSQLLNHDIWPSNYVNEQFAPFRNVACFMLYLGWSDKYLGMTTKMLDWIINLLLTLQQHDIIDSEVFLPRDRSTILKYKRWFPQPPVC